MNVFVHHRSPRRSVLFIREGAQSRIGESVECREVRVLCETDCQHLVLSALHGLTDEAVRRYGRALLTALVMAPADQPLGVVRGRDIPLACASPNSDSRRRAYWNVAKDSANAAAAIGGISHDARSAFWVALENFRLVMDSKSPSLQPVDPAIAPDGGAV